MSVCGDGVVQVTAQDVGSSRQTWVFQLGTNTLLSETGFCFRFILPFLGPHDMKKSVRVSVRDIESLHGVFTCNLTHLRSDWATEQDLQKAMFEPESSPIPYCLG